MSTILDTIIEKKKEEVNTLKQHGFEAYHLKGNASGSLYESLRSATSLQVIAEMKRASPSKGDIRTDVDPVAQARMYEKAGACAVSVLTDTPFFKGKMEDLAYVRREVSIPILCKDFIIDEIQIDRASDAGANVILLIVAALSSHRLKELYQYATSRGLEVLVEVHDEEEMKEALNVGASIIGINNRNLKTFEVDLGITEKLGAMIQGRDVVLISESGIKNPEDCQQAINAGASGVLVGETLMRSENTAETLASLQVRKDVTR
ncbi:indole-3-glycerol phosphate synthase TrpC [Bacillus sp. KH172YL63]|uniref:indole-3-glycerol phosphate synthase TrpC n=1 Tax=Bacillus sp. KH172YL63 TaxID=2709784 RepID=UPI0013E50F3D|nr:indole-3-glycerol phosphate synthase TrpC [Bacillus sp. KH172YL63]BCB04348.1 indole-3-glycerol phosphate synthase [Bacillus sp. KH172YL63]